MNFRLLSIKFYSVLQLLIQLLIDNFSGDLLEIIIKRFYEIYILYINIICTNININIIECINIILFQDISKPKEFNNNTFF